MQKIYCLTAALLFAAFANAQATDSLKNFRKFSERMNTYFEDNKIPEKVKERLKKKIEKKEFDGDMERWKRLEHYYADRLDKNGNMFNYVFQNHEALKQMQIIDPSATGNWQFVGPFNTEDNFDFTHDEGIGRVNCIAFIDADTWLVGTAGGGLWKTDVAGVYLPGVPPYDKPWTPLTDNNTVLSVSGIAVKPSAPNTIYILTGDGDWGAGQERIAEGVTPSVPSIGILKTVNGGTTWTQTNLVFGRNQLVSAHKLVMHPGNANIMYAATSDGLYKTTDGWNSFTKYLNGENVWDVELNPSSPNTVYISTNNKLYRSTGTTFNPVDITANIPNLDADVRRINIAVSAAASNNLYIITANSGRGLEGVYVSANQGNNITNMLDGHDLNILAHDGMEDVYADGQAEYDLAFAVDPGNANKIMVGGIGMWASYSGGISWAHLCGEDDLPDTYVHADIHTIEFNPFDNTIVTGTDGGVWAATAGDNTWEKRCQGLAITQYYHFDVNNSSSYFAGEIIGGAQDNGVTSNPVAAILSSADQFNPFDFEHQQRGGDGFNTFSGASNISGLYMNYRYADVQYGKLYLHSQDPVFGAWGYSEITPVEEYTAGEDDPNGSWDTPIEPNPNEFQSILAGYGDLYFSNNLGSNWNAIWNKPGTADHIRETAWNKNNGNNISFYSDAGLLVTTNQLYFGVISGNYNWQTENIYDITGNYVPVSDIQFTDDAYPNNLVITIPGYTDSVKVFRRVKDSTWKNISYNLPNVPVLCACVDEFGIYAGTDIGIFFLADKDSVWTYHSKNLPTVPVTQIEVVQDISGRRVYASTYGRGIWKSEPAPPKRNTRYYVNKTANGLNDGSTWANAFTKVQDAIFKAIPGDTIWVAKGTYYPTSASVVAGGSAARSYSFIIDSNTVIYGGFTGNETNFKQRNPSVNITELSGDIGVAGTATDNSYHVLTFINSTKNSIIDGFRIRDGYANGTNSIYPGTYRGGAILLSFDSTLAGRPFFNNCEFANNLAAQGGAVYISQYFNRDAKASFLKCTFSQNYTFNNSYGERGGAVCIDASPASNGPYGRIALAIDSCIFQYNNSPYGGAIYNDADNAGTVNYTINATQFLHNKTTTATGYGGAVYNYTSNKGKLNLTLNNCTFSDDDAPNGGGAVFNAGSSTLNDDDMQVYIKNCSFDSCSGYAVYSTGGKIFLSADKSGFTNNTGGIQHSGATSDGLSSGKITNCTFTNTVTGIYLNAGNSGTGLTNRSLSYNIDSCTFTNNAYGLYLYNYSQGGNAKHVQYSLSNSVFTGNTSGAVYNLGSDNCNISVTIKKNIFTNNKGSYGAAIYTNGYQNGFAELYIDSCSFIDNKAGLYGGALYNYYTDIISLTNCSFTRDSSASGGAVYNYAQYKNALYRNTFRNNTFTNNVSTGSGGAIVFSNNGSAAMNIDMVKNTFIGNKASYYGGSVYAGTASTNDTVNVNIDSCSFTNNTTTLNTAQSHGGALYLYSSGGILIPVIKNSEFKNNHTAARGGAIYAEESNYQKLNVSLLKCNIESNSSDLYGGALVVTSLGTSNLSIDSCTIKNNSAVSAIGGVYIYQNSFQCNASITNTIFDGNNTPGYSGALQINAAGPVAGSASKCIFKNNTANGGVAGAVRLYASPNYLNDFDFTNCLFDNNTASGDGGAAYIQTDDRGTLNNRFDNCVFNKNKGARGGALYATALNYSANVSVPLTNCTIANNNATTETGGVYATRANASATVRADLINTIIWNNTDAGTTANKKQAYVSSGALGYVKNSLIKDSIPAGYADSANNIFTDPLFVNANDADGTDNIFANADDGYTLQSGSPAINTGAAVSLATDITGLARPQGAAFDIGAYEAAACSVATVTGLALSNATSCSLKYTWAAVSGAAGYETEYKLNSSGTWISSGTVNVNQQTVTGLTANTFYDFRVRAKNNAGCTGNYAQLLNRKTDLYNEPENPTETNITATSAKLQWQLPACGTTPVNYTVQGKPASSGSWVTFTTPNRFYNATGLSPNTQYTWKVRANYSAGSSAYTTARNFTTLSAAAVFINDSIATAQQISPNPPPGGRGAELFQNSPNPFTTTTMIKCYVPQNSGHVYLNMYSNSGVILRSIKVPQTGMNMITVNAGSLSSGAYKYALVIDGKIVEGKTIILQK